MRSVIAWVSLAGAMTAPVAVAATSPLLEWRDTVYVTAGLAGIVGMALMLAQPLLAAGYLPGLALRTGRWLHRGLGAALVIAVLVHVGGLWITSPPDVVDALLLRSPTPFSIWGVIAMWALFASAVLALLRRRLGLRLWRRVHTGLVMMIVPGTVLHVLLIQGTMGTISKAVLCAMLGAVTLWVVADLRGWVPRKGAQG